MVDYMIFYRKIIIYKTSL